jgi:glycosyltransferase involved in cell wall biosynthesis
MKVSVIICTRNRASQLAAVLRSAQEMIVPDGLDWELLIVDNGSSDNTSEIVDGFRNSLPARCVREETPGLSNARNRGVKEARGEYICWTDDDVVIHKGWLLAFVEAFAKYPDASIFGGRVFPRLEGPTPRWFAKFKDLPPITTVLAKRDFGPEALPVSVEGGRIPWGANYALRTSEQRRHLYDSNLGTSANHRRNGEEVQLIRKLLDEGCSGWFVPDAKVDHVIPARRQSVRYIFEYFVSAGETWAFLRNADPILASKWPPNLEFRTVLKGVPSLAMRFMLYHATRFLLLRYLASPAVWLNDLRFFAFYYGAVGYWRKNGCSASHG